MIYDFLGKIFLRSSEPFHYTVVPLMEGHSFLNEKEASLEGDNLVVFYSLRSSKIRP